jgi:hypothetical protein
MSVPPPHYEQTSRNAKEKLRTGLLASITQPQVPSFQHVSPFLIMAVIPASLGRYYSQASRWSASTSRPTTLLATSPTSPPGNGEEGLTSRSRNLVDEAKTLYLSSPSGKSRITLTPFYDEVSTTILYEG